MEYTRLLKLILKSYEETLTDQEYVSFLNYVHGMMTKIIQDLSTLPPGSERGQKIQELLDIEIHQNVSLKTTCHKGCSACCHLHVEITADDAAVLNEGIQRMNVTVDQTRLIELASRTRNDEKWAAGVTAENRCLLLNSENSCSVYHFRPVACRKLIVTSDPNECLSVDGKILPIFMPKAEIILSAAINLKDNHFGSFAKMLAPYFENKKQTAEADLL